MTFVDEKNLSSIWIRTQKALKIIYFTSDADEHNVHSYYISTRATNLKLFIPLI